MNYEELLASKNGATLNKDPMPFGHLYKKMIDKTYTNVLDLRDDLTDSLRFCEALKSESARISTIAGHNQLHFQVSTDSSGLIGVTVEYGQFQTLEHTLKDNPAVVAEKKFVEDLIKSLVDTLTYLNSNNIYHLCFAPSNIIVRKGDTKPLLLFHGSSYLLLNDQESLYGDYAEYVAPEVLEEGTADARSEVYSLGKLMEFLYRDSSVPFEYRAVIKKATQQSPKKRYKTPEEMYMAMRSRRNERLSITMGALAALLAAIAIGIYMECMPETENVEFVESAPKEEFDDEVSPELYDPEMELKAATPDSNVTRVDEKQMQIYEKKAEEIFRKRYTQEADRILSKIYDNEHMNSSEKKFQSASTAVMEELTRKQIELGSEAGLNDTKSQRIASEIIERISNEKKSKLEQYGTQNKQQNDND